MRSEASREGGFARSDHGAARRASSCCARLEGSCRLSAPIPPRPRAYLQASAISDARGKSALRLRNTKASSRARSMGASKAFVTDHAAGWGAPTPAIVALQRWSRAAGGMYQVAEREYGPRSTHTTCGIRRLLHYTCAHGPMEEFSQSRTVWNHVPDGCRRFRTPDAAWDLVAANQVVGGAWARASRTPGASCSSWATGRSRSTV